MVCIICACLFLGNIHVFAQQNQSDTLLTVTTVDSVDTLSYKLWPNLLRSAIIPGWGQVEQGHNARALVFYGLSIYMIYNTVYYYDRYRASNANKYKTNFYKYLAHSVQIYALNLLDVIDSHRNKRIIPWSQEMFSDTPLKSPWGAVTRSAMLPGWGQIYNESYVKAAIAFGLCFDFARRIYVYHQRYKKTGDPGERDKRIRNSWYFGLVYFLNLVDAYVDAYLYRFNESIELTYHILPYDETFVLGVAIAF